MEEFSLPLRQRIGPALSLMFLAPVIAEWLPGATRLSAVFVFPLEFCIWGGGALLIRAAVRHWRLGWLQLLLLAFVLAIAEEFLIQQTSLAPLVIQIFPGAPYARAWGVNYVYFLWALFYEAVFVVVVPIALVELIFRSRREDPWLRKPGAIVVGVLFLLACPAAWFSWTHIARTQIFHQPAFDAPLLAIAVAVVAELLLSFAALGPLKNTLSVRSKPLSPFSPWLLGACGFIAACLWYCILLLAFRIRPQIPPAVPMVVGMALAASGILLLPRFAAHEKWSDAHRMGLVFGTLLGAMGVGFVGFMNEFTLPSDLCFKVVLNVLAIASLIWVSLRLKKTP
jgi:hypothetical protein